MSAHDSGRTAAASTSALAILPIFDVLEKAGEIDRANVSIFNMGIGMVLAVSADRADETMELLKSNGGLYVLGGIVKKTNDVGLQ